MSIIVLLVLALIPVGIIMWTQTRPDDNAPVVAEGTLTDISTSTTVAGSAPVATEPDATASTEPDQATTTTDAGDVGAVVQPLDDTPATTTTVAPRPTVTAAGSTNRPRPTAAPTTAAPTTTEAPTTTTTEKPDPKGICVFSDGNVASGLRESECLGTFTTDPDVARRLANERRSGTTVPPTTTTTTTSTTAPPTTVATTTTTTTSTPPTTGIDVTPTTAAA